jgi:4-alpha-glucanotransferase
VLKRYANERGVRIIGDIPIFVALDSADVWSRPELFFLDERGRPTVVAGVPPDYFSSTGQRWGNPLYRWDRMARDGYRWWVERFKIALTQVDLVRIDHFRGFQAYWEVLAQHKTAERGRWVEGPGEPFFRALEKALGKLPVIAEDLGFITPEVENLRLQLGFPGMKILQFAFGENGRNPYLPHNYERNFVVYTGTHDNDTTVGWFASRNPKERTNVLRYLGTSGREIHWDLIRLAFASVADLAIVPLQDVLGLGSWARMNMPGLPKGNWIWRLAPKQLKDEHAQRLRDLSAIYGRNQVSAEC